MSAAAFKGSAAPPNQAQESPHRCVLAEHLRLGSVGRLHATVSETDWRAHEVLDGPLSSSVLHDRGLVEQHQRCGGVFLALPLENDCCRFTNVSGLGGPSSRNVPSSRSSPPTSAPELVAVHAESNPTSKLAMDEPTRRAGGFVSRARAAPAPATPYQSVRTYARHILLLIGRRCSLLGMKTTTLTRQQLYDRVWSKPVDQLAKEIRDFERGAWQSVSAPRDSGATKGILGQEGGRPSRSAGSAARGHASRGTNALLFTARRATAAKSLALRGSPVDRVRASSEHQLVVLLT